jgi:hypothetical protein
MLMELSKHYHNHHVRYYFALKNLPCSQIYQIQLRKPTSHFCNFSPFTLKRTFATKAKQKWYLECCLPTTSSIRIVVIEEPGALSRSLLEKQTETRPAFSISGVNQDKNNLLRSQNLGLCVITVLELIWRKRPSFSWEKAGDYIRVFSFLVLALCKVFLTCLLEGTPPFFDQKEIKSLKSQHFVFRLWFNGAH